MTTVMALCEPQSLRSLCPRRASGMHIIEEAQMEVAPINTDLGMPLLLLLVPIYAGITALIAAIGTVIAVIRPARYLAQIRNSIVGTIAIDVVNLLRPTSVEERPSDAMGRNRSVVDAAGQITSIAHGSQRGLSGKSTIPRLRGGAGFERIGRALTPEYLTSIWVITEQFTKLLRGDIGAVSHLESSTFRWSERRAGCTPFGVRSHSTGALPCQK